VIIENEIGICMGRERAREEERERGREGGEERLGNTRLFGACCSWSDSIPHSGEVCSIERPGICRTGIGIIIVGAKYGTIG